MALSFAAIGNDATTSAVSKAKRESNRGDLADSAALLAALESGHLGSSALDVFDPEPIPAKHPIRKLPNVILAAHIAWASPAAVTQLRTTAAELALKALRGEPLPNIVNGVTAPR